MCRYIDARWLKVKTKSKSSKNLTLHKKENDIGWYTC